MKVNPIRVTVTGSDACVTEKPVITSGMVKIERVFNFYSEGGKKL